MNLEEAIAQLIGLGEKDPLVIARKIEERQGHAWLVEQLSAYAEDLVAELARQRLGSRRRTAEVAIRPGDPITSAEMKIATTFIPGVGWKKYADLTADDLDVRASMYDRLATAMGVRSAWCREVAGLMRAEGVRTLGKLKADLPVLPEIGLAELVAV